MCSMKPKGIILGMNALASKRVGIFLNSKRAHS